MIPNDRVHIGMRVGFIDTLEPWEVYKLVRYGDRFFLRCRLLKKDRRGHVLRDSSGRRCFFRRFRWSDSLMIYEYTYRFQ